MQVQADNPIHLTIAPSLLKPSRQTRQTIAEAILTSNETLRQTQIPLGSAIKYQEKPSG